MGPKPKIGKMSPFALLHPSPSILPPPLLPGSLGSDLVHLHIELLIETTSTQKKKKNKCWRETTWIIKRQFLLHLFCFFVLGKSSKFPLQREEKTSSTNREVAPLPGKAGKILQQPLRCSQEMISTFALGWDIHVLVVVVSEYNQ